jgi:hypothetical protein
MEVNVAPDIEQKLNDLATQSGRGTDEPLQDPVAGYFDLASSGAAARNFFGLSQPKRFSYPESHERQSNSRV